MIRYTDILFQLAEERIDYGWELLKAYDEADLKRGKPTFHPGDKYSLQLAIKEFMEYEKPEGFDLGEEIQRDFELVERVKNGEFVTGYTSKKFTNRNYHIQTSEGPINCAHLALAGVLPQVAYGDLQAPDTSLMEDTYTLGQLGEIIGSEWIAIKNQVDRKKSKLFGKYKLEIVRPLQDSKIKGKDVQDITRGLRSLILLDELNDYLIHRTGLRKQEGRRRLLRTIRRQGTGYCEDDPAQARLAHIQQPFGGFMFVNLRDVHNIANTLRRDLRLGNTHTSISEIARTHGDKVSTLSKYAEFNGVRRTSATLVSRFNLETELCGPQATHFLMSRYTNYSTADVTAQLNQNGGNYTRHQVHQALTDLGFLNGTERGARYLIPPRAISEVQTYFAQKAEVQSEKHVTPVPTLTYTQLRQELRSHGLQSTTEIVSRFLKENGYVEKNQSTPRTLPHSFVESVARKMRLQQKYSREYRAFCKEHGLGVATSGEKFKEHLMQQEEAA